MELLYHKIFLNHVFFLKILQKTDFSVFSESSIMKLATLLYSKIFVSLSLSKSVISFDNRLEAVRLSGQG